MAIVNYILPEYILNVQFSNFTSFASSSTPSYIVTHVASLACLCVSATLGAM